MTHYEVVQEEIKHELRENIDRFYSLDNGIYNAVSDDNAFEYRLEKKDDKLAVEVTDDKYEDANFRADAIIESQEIKDFTLEEYRSNRGSPVVLERMGFEGSYRKMVDKGFKLPFKKMAKGEKAFEFLEDINKRDFQAWEKRILTSN